MSAKERFLALIPRLSEAQAQAALDAVAELDRADALLKELREGDPGAGEGELLDQLSARGIDAETVRFLREPPGPDQRQAREN
jgi:hypothetical protein